MTPTDTPGSATPMPPATPAASSSTRVTSTEPSERSATVHEPVWPRWRTAIVTAKLAPFARSCVRQGASPSAVASAGRHTSPPTMHRPVRIAATRRAGTPPAPVATPAPASTTATRASSAA